MLKCDMSFAFDYKKRIVKFPAHCLDGSTSSLVVAGVHNVNTIEETQQRRRIQSYDYKIHENFNPQTLQNDIAALLIRDVPFSETREVQFAQLPYDYKRELFVGSMVSIVSFKFEF